MESSINMKLYECWEKEETWIFIVSYSCELFNNTLQNSIVFSLRDCLFCGPRISVSLQGKPAKDTLLTTCSLSCTRGLPRLIFFALSSRWFMAFPYVAIKLLESALRDELMPLKYISVSCPLMVLFKNTGRVGAAWFLLKFSFPSL